VKAQEERLMRTFLSLLAAAAVAALVTGPLQAQGQQDFSKVEITTTKISNNFVALDGQGGRIGVLYGPDGIFRPAPGRCAIATTTTPTSASTGDSSA